VEGGERQHRRAAGAAAQLAGRPLLPQAVEEALRWESPVAGMAVSRARNVERPDGLGSRTTCRPVNGLALERGASLPGLAAVWLEKGASASTVIRHARRGFPVSFDDDVECADDGSDDRGRPA
jgi:hypothetical protein